MSYTMRITPTTARSQRELTRFATWVLNNFKVDGPASEPKYIGPMEGPAATRSHEFSMTDLRLAKQLADNFTAHGWNTTILNDDTGEIVHTAGLR